MINRLEGDMPLIRKNEEMNSIKNLFERKKENILSVYFTAGYPEFNDTNRIIEALVNNGVDMIEIGMPYSDPVADGPVIERSSAIAIGNGMTIKTLFDQLKQSKLQKDVPLIFMGYLNPVMQYGYEAFCRDAADAGISGLILPDLPLREYLSEMKQYADKYDLRFISLVTPETTPDRIRKIDDLSDGFIYAVSSSSITGRATDGDAKEKYLQRLQSMNLKNPVLVGFGIKDRGTFAQACHHTNGAIIGTEFINRISENRDFEKTAQQFVNDIV